MYAMQLIKSLDERDQRGQLGIILAVDTLGKEECRRLLEIAQKTHGKLFTNDGERQRTLGGCFFAAMDKNVRRALNKKRREVQKRNELKAALEDMLYLIYEYVSPSTFKNGNEYQGADEGQVLCAKMITDTKKTLKKHMTLREVKESPVFSQFN